jgi:tetratricopeptide (TPR) repeat protein
MPRLGAFLLLMAAAMVAGCQSSNDTGQLAKAPTPELQRQYDQAFQEMLAQPGSPEVVLKYANAATQAGDLEGAIAALEGLLLVDSDLPQVQLQLASLYYRLKAYDVSRNYLETALKSPTLTPDVRQTAEQILAKMPKGSPRNKRA